MTFNLEDNLFAEEFTLPAVAEVSGSDLKNPNYSIAATHGVSGSSGKFCRRQSFESTFTGGNFNLSACGDAPSVPYNYTRRTSLPVKMVGGKSRDSSPAALDRSL